jgi:MerR family transcriptional regulator/heat shock protein HspR
MHQGARPKVKNRTTGPSQATNVPSAPEKRAARPEATPEPVAEGVYVISVAARMLEMHPQTLRKYERLGLVSPSRTVGMLRLYSREDIRKLYLIRYLVENLGFNLAGVEFALALVDRLLQMQDRLGAMAKSTSLESLVEEELAQLFDTLNLPMDSGRIYS